MKKLHPPTAHFIGEEVKAALAATMEVVAILLGRCALGFDVCALRELRCFLSNALKLYYEVVYGCRSFPRGSLSEVHVEAFSEVHKGRKIKKEQTQKHKHRGEEKVKNEQSTSAEPDHWVAGIRPAAAAAAAAAVNDEPGSGGGPRERWDGTWNAAPRLRWSCPQTNESATTSSAAADPGTAPVPAAGTAPSRGFEGEAGEHNSGNDSGAFWRADSSD